MSSKGKALHEQFREGHHTSEWKGNATETLMLYPILKHWANHCVIQGEPKGQLDDDTASLNAVCHLCDVIQAAKIGCTRVQLLKEAYEAHMALHLRAYGTTHVVPKHHYNAHIHQQIEADGGSVLDCFCTERKNALPKSRGSHVDRTTDFERSVLTRMVVEQLRQLAKPVFSNCLWGDVRDAPELVA